MSNRGKLSNVFTDKKRAVEDNGTNGNGQNINIGVDASELKSIADTVNNTVKMEAEKRKNKKNSILANGILEDFCKIPKKDFINEAEQGKYQIGVKLFKRRRCDGDIEDAVEHLNKKGNISFKFKSEEENMFPQSLNRQCRIYATWEAINTNPKK